MLRLLLVFSLADWSCLNHQADSVSVIYAMPTKSCFFSHLMVPHSFMLTGPCILIQYWTSVGHWPKGPKRHPPFCRPNTWTLSPFYPDQTTHDLCKLPHYSNVLDIFRIITCPELSSRKMFSMVHNRLYIRRVFISLARWPCPFLNISRSATVLRQIFHAVYRTTERHALFTWEARVASVKSKVCRQRLHPCRAEFDLSRAESWGVVQSRRLTAHWPLTGRSWSPRSHKTLVFLELFRIQVSLLCLPYVPTLDWHSRMRAIWY